MSGPEPYGKMADEELEAAWRGLLDGYADRLAYFEGLPEWQRQANLRKMEADGCEAWSLSRGEYIEWCSVLLDHHLAARDISDAAMERRRRLREAARARVSSMPDLATAEAEAEAYRPPYGPSATWRLPGEGMAAYVRRIESYRDAASAWRGARQGCSDVLDREIDERLSRASRCDRGREEVQGGLLARQPARMRKEARGR